ncbi:uncharacterized protein PADG_00356 [Paracoccidioides brasiliensis Pb18]|uniref:Uncharacterized protein n=1 Tax=Paracoccidioides brasiliensis (strain Pb18) TaxID=502780 RepID=C1G0G6_PARBD|nr:uncharacterized protein PADG_00356 [Paracoccidioides brasiliensis Pb18]EEH44067.2 hypothetical protein PADG_00356 [Paracoccidioides brasiliensis Pb18]
MSQQGKKSAWMTSVKSEVEYKMLRLKFSLGQPVRNELFNQLKECNERLEKVLNYSDRFPAPQSAFQRDTVKTPNLEDVFKKAWKKCDILFKAFYDDATDKCFNVILMFLLCKTYGRSGLREFLGIIGHDDEKFHIHPFRKWTKPNDSGVPFTLDHLLTPDIKDRMSRKVDLPRKTYCTFHLRTDSVSRNSTEGLNTEKGIPLEMSIRSKPSISRLHCNGLTVLREREYDVSAVKWCFIEGSKSEWRGEMIKNVIKPFELCQRHFKMCSRVTRKATRGQRKLLK